MTRAADPFAAWLAVWTADWRRRLARLRFGPPVGHVYNPLEYAQESFREYVSRHARRGVPAVLLGMNPGPWGMVQTGVPFGAVELVRNWLGITAAPEPPAAQHPRVPVLGFECPREEVSGRRLWGWARERFGTPARFFEHYFVANYCPLAFLEAGGRNLTPDKLPAAQAGPLRAACDHALQRLVDFLQPTWVIGIGAYAARRAEQALGDRGVKFGQILHPSPASPLANRDWQGTIERQLSDLGLPGKP